MICNNCGSNIPDGATFCTSCGSKISQPNRQSQQTQQNSYYQQPSYNQNGYGGYQQPNTTVVINQTSPEYHPEEHVTVGGWIGRWLLTAIPVVGIVMLFVWAFGSTRQRSLKTWARAQLILSLIIGVVGVIIFIIMCAVTGGLAWLVQNS